MKLLDKKKLLSVIPALALSCCSTIDGRDITTLIITHKDSIYVKINTIYTHQTINNNHIIATLTIYNHLNEKNYEQI